MTRQATSNAARQAGAVAAFVMVLASVLLWSAGCVGYRLGSTLPRDIRTIYVPVFRNETGEPQLEAETTDAVTEAFQKDGALSVVPSAATADLLLDVTLTKYETEPLRYDNDREKTANEYRIRLTAEFVCTSRKTGKVFADSRAVGKATFTPSGGMALSKKEALPDAAEDLAHNIVEQIVEAW